MNDLPDILAKAKAIAAVSCGETPVAAACNEVASSIDEAHSRAEYTGRPVECVVEGSRVTIYPIGMRPK